MRGFAWARAGVWFVFYFCNTYWPGASATASPMRGGWAGLPERAFSQSFQAGHHEPSWRGAAASQASGVRLSPPAWRVSIW